MKKQLFTFLFYCIYHCSCSQSLSHSVIGASGDVFHSLNGSLDWTIGEMMTETYIQESKMFTQGFHQPEIEPTDPGLEIHVHPNPVPNFLNVMGKKNSNYKVEVFNTYGQKLIERNINLNLNESHFQIDFRDFIPSLYVLRIFNIDTGQVSSFKIEKI